jgi:hypothetical protein
MLHLSPSNIVATHLVAIPRRASCDHSMVTWGTHRRQRPVMKLSLSLMLICQQHPPRAKMATLSKPTLPILRGMSSHTKDVMRFKKRSDFDVEIDFEVSTGKGRLHVHLSSTSRCVSNTSAGHLLRLEHRQGAEVGILHLQNE